MTPAVRRAVVGERRDLPFVRVRPYAELLDRQVRPWSMGTTLLALFSTLALLVASMGLYAAFAHAVTERRREMAIRMAIGVAPSTLIAMVLGEAVRVSASGAMAGCLVALAAGRWLQSLLFGTEASDPLVLASAAVLMVVVAILATVRPARVAAQSDPAALLKVD
jgi:putative ABC transport system permease protein